MCGGNASLPAKARGRIEFSVEMALALQPLVSAPASVLWRRTHGEAKMMNLRHVLGSIVGMAGLLLTLAAVAATVPVH